MSFLELCIFSGCDYLPSIKGIGLATACKLLIQYNDIFKVGIILIGYKKFEGTEGNFCSSRHL